MKTLSLKSSASFRELGLEILGLWQAAQVGHFMSNTAWEISGRHPCERKTLLSCSLLGWHKFWCALFDHGLFLFGQGSEPWAAPCHLMCPVWQARLALMAAHACVLYSPQRMETEPLDLWAFVHAVGCQHAPHGDDSRAGWHQASLGHYHHLGMGQLQSPALNTGGSRELWLQTSLYLLGRISGSTFPSLCPVLPFGIISISLWTFCMGFLRLVSLLGFEALVCPFSRDDSDYLEACKGLI